MTRRVMTHRMQLTMQNGSLAKIKAKALNLTKKEKSKQ